MGWPNGFCNATMVSSIDICAHYYWTPWKMELRKLALGIGAAALAAGSAGQVLAQQAPANLLAAGSFEQESVSLRLPELSPFPLVVGGWGSRADDAGAASVTAIARGGLRALEINSRADAAAHVIQDAPLGTVGFVFRVAVQRRRGQQSISMQGEWDRMDPEARALIRLDLRAGTLRVTTTAGSWTVPAPLGDRDWHDLELRSDPRTGQVAVSVDGALQGLFPGAPVDIPRTVILGARRGQSRSGFRYDDLALLRLPEIELLALRDALVAAAAPAGIQRRLQTAHQALLAGSASMMAAELRAASRLLDPVRDAGVRTRLDLLIELAEAR